MKHFLLLFFSLSLLQIATGQGSQIINDSQNPKANPNTFTVESSEQKLLYKCGLNSIDFEEMEIEGNRYQTIQINGFAKLQIEGAPDLPVKRELIAIPEGANIELNILNSQIKSVNDFSLAPTRKLTDEDEQAADYEFDSKVYSKDELFPSSPVFVEEILKFRGISIAVVNICPAQYNPITKELLTYSKLEFEVSFSGDNKGFEALEKSTTPQALKSIKAIVRNGNQIPAPINGYSSKSSGKNMIIVCHEDYYPAAQRLKHWKNQIGYTVDIVTGKNLTENFIKQEIDYRYHTWDIKPDYVILIGDHNGDYACPAREKSSKEKGETYLTDLYYSCFDGPDDYFPDLAVGRITASDPSDAVRLVNKIIHYEKQPVNDNDFYSNVANCAYFQDVWEAEPPDGYSCKRYTHTSEEIRDYLIDNFNYNVQRIYNTGDDINPQFYENGNYSNGEALPFDLLRVNGYEWNGNTPDILDAINDGRFLIMHRGHGNVNGWANPNFKVWDLGGLQNIDKHPIVLSVNCLTGAFHNNDCFAEKLFEHEHGAVGVIAFTKTSMPGFNDAFLAGVIDAIWSEPGLTPAFGSYGVQNPDSSLAYNVYSLGDVKNYGLNRMLQTYGYSREKYEIAEYFGDPSMKIWTANPNTNTLSADVPQHIYCDDVSIQITEINENDANISLMFDDELIESGVVSGNNYVFNFSPPGNHYQHATITLTKHNCKPFVYEVPFINNCENLPIAEFLSNVQHIKAYETIDFFDLSDYQPNYWKWSFPGAEIPESNLQHPDEIMYTQPGVYDVQLIACNSFGCDTVIKENYITVDDNQYCEVQSENVYEYIERLIAGDIDNTTAYNENGYSNYMQSHNLLVERGDAFDLEVFVKNNLPTNKCKVWIDWDRNKIFNNEDELVFVSEMSANVYTKEISIPNEALDGEMSMRIRLFDAQNNIDVTACDDLLFGETEDYSLFVCQNDYCNCLVRFVLSADDFINKESLSIELEEFGVKYFDENGVAEFEVLGPRENLRYAVFNNEQTVMQESFNLYQLEKEIYIDLAEIGEEILEKNDGFALFPNPAKNTVFIKGNISMQRIIISDLSGRKYIDKQLNIGYRNLCEIDIRGFKPGVYLVQVQSGNQTVYNKKLVLL